MDLIDILEFYIKRNNNANYSKKLNSEINKNLNLIAKHPLMGLKTDVESVRALISGDLQIIYEIVEKTILVVMIWDCRRAPEKKIIIPKYKK